MCESVLLGTHLSIAGGYINALTEAQRLGINTMQIFTKNQRYWKERFVTREEGELFKTAMQQHGVKQAFSHAIYLISLGSANEDIVEKSILSLAMELERCHALGLSHTVLHPGAAGSSTPEKAILRIGDHIKTALKATKKNPVKILIENTAGSGTSIGGRIEYLADLIDHIGSKRVGLCIDTCHAFAAGYDIRTRNGTKNFFKFIDVKIGYDKLLCFHLNDSKGSLGSRLDRHAHIGEGLLGLEPFTFIMRNFPHIPKVLETNKENDADKRNLGILRSLSKQK
jgi:deoxyribonuclease-4